MAKLKSKHHRYTIFIVSVFITTLVAGAVSVQMVLAGQIPPNTFAFNEDLSWQSAEDAQEELSVALEAFEAEPIEVVFNGETHAFSKDALGITLHKTDSIEIIPVINLRNALWLIPVQIANGKQIEVSYSVDQDLLLAALESNIPDLVRDVKEPQMVWSRSLGDFEVTPEETGQAINLEEFQAQLESQLANLENEPVNITTKLINPIMTAVELEAQKDTVTDALGQDMFLYTDENYWTVNWAEHLDLLTFEPAQWASLYGGEVEIDELDAEHWPEHLPLEKRLSIILNDEAFSDYIRETFAGEIEVDPQDVTIIMSDDGDISFEGTAVDGVKIEYDSLNTLTEIALNKKIQEVEIPLQKTPGKVDAPQELIDLGITELVATGYSNFYGSPYNRIHNIGVGIARYNGVLIAPGETFSFGDQLGVVDGSMGYLPELVIKEEGTIPEYGGGICQVSSTLYRAVLFAGLPVVERHPHSYAVSYYAYPMGWGLDATVYPPAVDLQFTNDMESYLLIQSYSEGTDAYFKFYGTKDGRTVSMDGPYISNRVGAPSAVYTITDTLPAGIIEKKDSAHNGFTATWYRTITHPDGTTETEIISSVYRAWAAKYLVGAGTKGFEEEE